jgi:hypothetical protein
MRPSVRWTAPARRCQDQAEENVMSTSLPPASAAAPRRHSFVERLLGALRLDAAVFDEVEHDRGALGQAAAVVALGGVATAIGAAGEGGGAFGAVLGAFLGWLISAGFVWLIGVFLMEHTSDYPELLRTLGFASAPQLLLALRGVPLLGVLIAVAAFLWGLAAWVVAVRQALDVSTGRAVWVCVLAVLVYGACVVGLALLLGGLLGGFGRGPGAMGF